MRVDTRPETPALWYLVAESLRITHGRVDWLQTRVVRYGFVAGGNNSVVECDLAKVEVAGSNPVSRSNLRSDSMMIPTCCSARCCCCCG